MHHDYIPESDEGALIWLRVFAGALAGDPAAFGVGPEAVAEVGARVAAFAEAFRLAVAPETRGPRTVFAKTERRREAVAVCRRVAQQIKADAAIPADVKLLAGVRPVNPRRSRVPLGGTLPTLDVGLTPTGGHRVAFADQAAPRRRAKPAGVVGLQLFRRLEGAPGPLELVGTYPRGPVVLTYDRGAAGARVTYTARWINRRGEQSLYSQPVTMMIAA